MREVGDANYAVEFLDTSCMPYSISTMLFAVYESQRPSGLRARTMADGSRLPRWLVMLYMVCLHACLPSPSGSFLHSSCINGGAVSSPKLMGPPRACRASTPRWTAVVGPMRAELEQSQPTAVQEEKTGPRRLEDLKVDASFTSSLFFLKLRLMLVLQRFRLCHVRAVWSCACWLLAAGCLTSPWRHSFFHKAHKLLLCLVLCVCRSFGQAGWLGRVFSLLGASRRKVFMVHSLRWLLMPIRLGSWVSGVRVRAGVVTVTLHVAYQVHYSTYVQHYGAGHLPARVQLQSTS